MASLQAQGGAPVSFLDANGVQYSIPLALITFPSATGTPTAAAWLSAQPAALQPLVNAWLQSLAGQGLLTASAVPAAPPAFSIAARDPGFAGNDITVTFANVVPNVATPAQTVADVTVSTTQVYNGLTLATIATVLGTTAGGGTQPGLAYVSNVNTVATALPVATTAPENFPATPTPVQLAIAAASGNAFTLIACHQEADASRLQASISNVDTTRNSFTLTLTWSKFAAAVPLASLSTQFGYVLTVTPPQGGFAYPPAAGSTTLLGGTNATPATVAQAVVVAG